MNTHNNNEQNKEITINDIKAIKEFEHISDDDANEMVDSIKQLSLVMYQFQKQSIPALNVTKSNKLILHKREYKQVA